MRSFFKWIQWVLLPVFPFSVLATETIDVLVVYTGELEARYTDRDGVGSLIDASFYSANQSFERSEVDVRLRLVAFRKIDYDERNNSMDTSLDNLSERDGVLDEVLDWRDEYGADLVYLFRGIADGNTTGIAWVLQDTAGKDSLGFGVATGNYLLSSLVFQHEVGHNLGAAHDRENAKVKGLYEDSHGYRFWDRTKTNTTTYRTVMAYDPGIGVNQFSNPDLEYGGLKTGVAEGDESANNVRALRATAASVAGYREFQPNFPPEADGGPDIWAEVEAGEEYAKVLLDASGSWVVPAVDQWLWTWEGGTASGEIVEVDLPMGRHEIELRITDEYGKVGVDTVVVTVSGAGDIVSTHATNGGIFVVKDNGTALASGENANGALGVGTTESVFELTSVSLGNIRSVVSNGYDRSLFITESGALYGSGKVNWTYDDFYWNVISKVPVKLVDTGVVAAAIGDEGGYYVTESGALWGWGNNNGSVLGDGEPGRWKKAVEVISEGVEEVQVKGTLVLVTMKDGSVWGAGGFERYRLGLESLAENDSFLRLYESGVSKVVLTHNLVVALRTDGGIEIFGDLKRDWQIVRKDDGESEIALILEGGAVDVWAEGQRILYKKEDGSIWGIGNGLFSRDGFLSGGYREWFPLWGSGVAELRMGTSWVVTRNDGSVWAIGHNAQGQLGIGSEPEYLSTLTKMPWSETIDPSANLAPVIEVEGQKDVFDTNGDGYVSVHLDASGSSDDWSLPNFEWTFGDQFVDTEILEANFPVGETDVLLKVFDEDGAVSEYPFVVTVEKWGGDPLDVEVGREDLFLIRSDGSLWGLGLNEFGQFGTGGTDPTEEEWIRIFDGGVVKCSAGDEHVLVLKDDGSLWAAGGNSYGQLGDGTREDKLEFVEIVSEGIVDVYADEYRSWFLNDQGALMGMGSNSYGRLGTAGGLILEPKELFRGEEGSPLVEIQEGFVLDDRGRGFGVVQLDLKSGVFTKLPGEGVSHVGKLGRDGVYLIDEYDRLFDILYWYSEERNRWGLGERSLVEHGLLASGVAQLAGSYKHVFLRTVGGAVLGLDTEDLRADGFGLSEGSVDVVFGSGVVDVSTGDLYSVFVLEDGSIWGMGHFESLYFEDSYSLFAGMERGGPLQLVAPSERGEDLPPVAIAGGDKSVVDLVGSGAMVLKLNAEESHDDRFIVDWSWSIGEESLEGRIVSYAFPVGRTEVELVVRDASGQESSDTITVEVLPDFEISSIESNARWCFVLLDDGSVYVSASASPFASGRHTRMGHCVKLDVSGIVDVSVSETHALLLADDGGVWYLGFNMYGSVGRGYSGSSVPLMKIVDGGVQAIAAGLDTSFLIKDNGSLWAAGANYRGELGLGDDLVVETFAKVVESGVSRVSADDGIAAFVKEDGSLWQMGHDVFADREDREQRFREPTLLLSEGVEDLAVGDHSLYLKMQDGSLRGMSSLEFSLTPEGVGLERWSLIFRENVAQVEAYGAGALVILEGGELWKVYRPYPSDVWEEPRMLLPQGVLEAKPAPGGVLVLRSDGVAFGQGQVSRFRFGEFDDLEPSGPWTRLAGISTGWQDVAPVAKMNVQRGYHFIEAGVPFFLDGEASIDDWQIKSWLWKVNGEFNSGYSRTWLEPSEGSFLVELTVEDAQGSLSTVSKRIDLVDRTRFEEALANYFDLEEIHAMKDVLRSDTDGDGFGNALELELGTDPSVFMSRPTFVWEKTGSGYVLKVEGLHFGARVWGMESDDLEQWREMGMSGPADEEGNVELKTLHLGERVFIRIE